jgi:hypothetical protein
LLHCICRQPFITSANPKHLPALLRTTQHNLKRFISEETWNSDILVPVC